MSELGPNAHGELCDPGRVTDCYLALPLPAEHDGPGRVLVVAPRALLDPAVAQPTGSLLYEADLAAELRAWPPDTAAPLTSELAAVSAAVVWCWQRGTCSAWSCPSRRARTRGRWSARR